MKSLREDRNGIWGVRFESPRIFVAVVLVMACLIINTLHWNGVGIVSGLWMWTPLIIFFATLLVCIGALRLEVGVIIAILVTLFYYFVIMSGQLIFFTTAGMV